jgi:hypothetical protein
VQGTPPEVDHGQRTTLAISTADNVTRDVQVIWFFTPFPLASVIANGLLNPDAGTADAGAQMGPSFCDAVRICQQIGSIPFGTFQCSTSPMPTFTTPTETGSLDSQGREVMNVTGWACAGGTIGCTGDSGNIPFTCDGANARGWMFSKSIFVHSTMSLNPPNQNPHISEVRFGPMMQTSPIAMGAPPIIDHCTDQTVDSMCPKPTFEVLFADGSREHYLSRDPNTSAVNMRTERLTVGYVIDRGTLAGGFRNDSPTDDNRMVDEYRAPATAGTVNVFVYASDGRGGFDFTRRRICIDHCD